MRFVKHKNAVTSLHGLILTLSALSKKNLEVLLGTKIKDQKIFKDGIILYIRDGKTDKFESIIMNSSNFNKTLEFTGRSGKIINIHDEEMIRIKPPKSKDSLNWDILIRKDH